MTHSPSTIFDGLGSWDVVEYCHNGYESCSVSKVTNFSGVQFVKVLYQHTLIAILNYFMFWQIGGKIV